MKTLANDSELRRRSYLAEGEELGSNLLHRRPHLLRGLQLIKPMELLNNAVTPLFSVSLSFGIAQPDYWSAKFVVNRPIGVLRIYQVLEDT